MTVTEAAAAAAVSGPDWFARVVAVLGLVTAAGSALLGYKNFQRQKNADDRAVEAERRRQEQDSLASYRLRPRWASWGPPGGPAWTLPIEDDITAGQTVGFSLAPLPRAGTVPWPMASRIVGLVVHNEGRAAVEVREVWFIVSGDQNDEIGISGGKMDGPTLPSLLPGLHLQRWGWPEGELRRELELRPLRASYRCRIELHPGDGTIRQSNDAFVSLFYRAGEESTAATVGPGTPDSQLS